MRWSLRYQLLIPLLILLLGVVGISTWTALASVSRARQQIETHMRNVARTLSESSVRLAPNWLEPMKGLSGAEYLLVEGPDRRTATFATGRVQLPPAGAVAADWHSLRLGPPVAVDGQTYLCSGVRLRHWPNAGAVLYIFYPEALWRDALWQAVRPSLVLGAVGGLASVLLAVGVGQRLSRRIRELERRTRLIAAGDFRPIPLSGADDELRDLGRSVNDMAQRLARLQEAVQQAERLRLVGQVSGGLAHQLRNGVTGARLAVQLHARECAGRVNTEALEVALRQLALLEAHLKRFLELGHREGLRREPCCLAAVVDEAVALFRPQCRHARIDLRWHRPAAGVPLWGDAGQLGQLFLNVVGNAVEAAGPGGVVDVRLGAAADGTVVVEVSDSGPGPPPDIAGRLFEPFVTGKRDGVGLGLAVARQVAEAHGGGITFRREAGQTRFRIELPGRRDTTEHPQPGGE
jgi:signal transduction histidine kinase